MVTIGLTQRHFLTVVGSVLRRIGLSGRSVLSCWGLLSLRVLARPLSPIALRRVASWQTRGEDRKMSGEFSPEEDDLKKGREEGKYRKLDRNKAAAVDNSFVRNKPVLKQSRPP